MTPILESSFQLPLHCLILFTGLAIFICNFQRFDKLRKKVLIEWSLILLTEQRLELVQNDSNRLYALKIWNNERKWDDVVSLLWSTVELILVFWREHFKINISKIYLFWTHIHTFFSSSKKTQSHRLCYLAEPSYISSQF